MMRHDRLNKLEQYILQRETVSFEELAGEFSVSLNTVRRDIEEIIPRGKIKKVYGGVSSAQTPLPFTERAARQGDAKRIIGELAASLVEDSTSIFLDSGSTTPFIIPHLATKKDITVITHSLSALVELAKYPSMRVIALGGQYNPTTASYVGATDQLSRMRADIVFIAATGVSLTHGLTNTTYFEAEIKRTVTEKNDRIVLVADHTKFEKKSLITFCDFSRLSAVVTDAPPSGEYLQSMQTGDIRLLCAK